MTKAMEALLAKSAKLQSAANTLNADDDERHAFGVHFFPETACLEYCYAKSFNPILS